MEIKNCLVGTLGGLALGTGIGGVKGFKKGLGIGAKMGVSAVMGIGIMASTICIVKKSRLKKETNKNLSKS